MGTIEDIRTALAAAMSSIDGLSTEEYIRDIADTPVAMVGGPTDVEYDATFGRGHDDYTFTIFLFASRVDEEAAQEDLDSYIDPFGPKSIKQAIETNEALKGVVEDVRVQRTQEYQPHDINGVTYLGAVMIVGIMASGKA